MSTAIALPPATPKRKPPGRPRGSRPAAPAALYGKPRPDDFLLLGECASLTRSSIGTVRFWIATGRLPASKIGLRVLVRRRDLDQFVESGRLPAVAR
jgi:excisionase family DNA binding protein